LFQNNGTKNKLIITKKEYYLSVSTSCLFITHWRKKKIEHSTYYRTELLNWMSSVFTQKHKETQPSRAHISDHWFNQIASSAFWRPRNDEHTTDYGGAPGSYFL